MYRIQKKGRKKENGRTYRPISTAEENDVASKGCSTNDEWGRMEVMAIQKGLGKRVVEAIQLWKHDIHTHGANSGNVQILEKMAGACKNQLVTLTGDGAKRLRLCGNQAEKESAGRNRQEFLNV